MWDGIREFYDQRFWNLETLLEAHRPFHGVLEIIRWFQLQPNTEVGLNSGRPEELRAETLLLPLVHYGERRQAAVAAGGRTALFDVIESRFGCIDQQSIRA